jgi:solute carrier family 50 protein (sugar transporter)
MPEQTLLFTTILPLCGNVLATGQYLAPIKDVLAARDRGDNGSLNSFPYICQLAQCILWCLYGVLINSIAVAPLNLFGAACGLFYSLVTLRNESAENYNKQQTYFIIAIVLPSAIFLAVSMGISNYETKVNVLGSITTGVALIYLASPLSTVRTIVQTRNAASISVPLGVAVLCSSTFWGIYSMAIGDMFLLMPQLTGFTLACFQLGLRFYFRKTTTSAADSELPNPPAVGNKSVPLDFSTEEFDSIREELKADKAAVAIAMSDAK